MVAPLHASWLTAVFAIEIEPSFDSATPDEFAAMFWFSTTSSTVKSAGRQSTLSVVMTVWIVPTATDCAPELSAVNDTDSLSPGERVAAGDEAGSTNARWLAAAVGQAAREARADE